MTVGSAASEDKSAPGPSELTGAARVIDRILRFRDRWLARPAFQRWAASFPLTRPIARRRARELFDLCAGFAYSQVLLACVQLRLFDVLAAEPLTLPAIAARIGLPPEAARRLLGAALALRLVEGRGPDRYGLGPLGVVLVDNRGVQAMIEHHGLVYRDLADPVALLRGEDGATRLGRYWPYAGASDPALLDAASTAAYTTLMSQSLPLICDEVLDAYPLDRHRRLLDVGGGEGTFAIAALRRAPRLEAVVFDLPAVAARASARFVAEGLGARGRAVGGDFLRGPLPEGADLVTLVRVLHDHDDVVVARLLGSVRAAMPPDGRLLIVEPLSGTPGAEAVGGAYLAFYLLAMGSGRTRTRQELARLLARAGFEAPRALAVREPLHTAVLLAGPRR